LAIHYNVKTVTDGLVLALDAANPKSYSGSGNTWNDLSGNGNTGTLVNGVSYNSGYGATRVTGTRTDANASSLVLAIPMDGANNGTTFTDESANIKGSGSAKSITRNGDTKTVTTVSKFYGSSGYFDGSGDTLSCADSDDWYFSSGNSTAECWVYPTASPNQPILMGQWDGVGGGTGLSWAMMLSNDSNRYLRALISSTGSGVDFDLVSSTSLGLNQWNHCAFVRNGSTFTLYLNGVSVASTTNSNALFNATNSLTIGASSNGSQPFNGYLQDLRIYKGLAKYTSNFIPFGNPNTTPTGAFPIYNTKDVGGSLTFNGSNQFVSNTLPNLGISGNAAITLSCWFYTSASSFATLLSYGGGAAAGDTFSLIVDANGVISVHFNGGNGTLSSSNVFLPNTWNNFTATKTPGAANTTTKLYLNGIELTISSSTTITPNFIPNVLNVGRWVDATYGFFYPGRISQVSIYNRALSAAEVAQNYNALKSRYLIQYIDPYYPYVSLLLRNSFTDESPSPKTITTSGTASITTTAGQWKYSGSAFSLTKSTSSYIQAGVANDSAFDFGSGDFTIEAWINPSVVSGYNAVVGTTAGPYNAEGWGIYVTSGQLSFNVYSNTSTATFIITGGTITLNSYSHIAVTRSGSTIRSFINGTLVTSGSLSGALVTTNAYSKFLRVGFQSYTDGVFDYAGFIDDLRITKGVARYTANFTPPTTESSTGYYNI
jgi:hypothetical protein